MPRYIRCSVCRKRSPRPMMFRKRMEWLRRHYKKKHPAKFKKWGNKK